MKKSKDVFLETIQEGIMYDATFTKKEAKQAGVEAAKKIIDLAERDPLEVLSNVVRLKEVLTSMEAGLKEARELIGVKQVKSLGVTYTPSNTGDRLNYEQDDLYMALKNKLKAREEQLKTVYKTKTEMYDDDGVKIPLVEVKTHGKQTIRVTF